MALIVKWLTILGNVNKVRYNIIIQIGDLGFDITCLDRLMTPTSVQNSPYSCHY